MKLKNQETLTKYLVNDKRDKRYLKRITGRISKRIEKYNLSHSWEDECYELFEKVVESHGAPIGNSTKLIDSILLLLCKRKRVIEPKELIKATRGGRGRSASKSFHFFRVLEMLNGYKPAKVEEYVKSFFSANPDYEMFLEKALDIASKTSEDFHKINQRIFAAACIYISSIGEHWGTHKPIIHQREVATFFKITTVSVRNTYVQLLSKLKKINTKLSKKELEWLFSYRQEQLRKGF